MTLKSCLNISILTIKNKTINAQLTELLSGSITASIQFSNDELPKSALLLLELYRHKEQLKLRYIGQGFAQGISKLFTSYDVTEATVQKATMLFTAVIASTSAKSVTVSNTQLDDILVNMHWDAKQLSVHHGANLFMGENFKPMTDLRVDVYTNCIKLSEDLLGSFHDVHYIEALRSENSHVEQLVINVKYQHKSHRYLIYALMAEGHNNWSALNVEIEFQLTQSQKPCFSPDTLMMKPVYAVAMLEFEQGEITMTALNEYFENLPELDQAYGWGLVWRYQIQSENEE
jgi:tellurite resistance protein TerA